MLRQSLSLLVAWVTLALPAGLSAQNVLIPQSTAQRHGLTKAWYSQIELDRSIDHVAYITQQGGMLYVQTTHAMVHALDAETGRKIWNVQIGRRNQISYAPGVNENLLAVINGSTMYVVERKTGRLKWERQMQGAPGAGPALGKKRIYVGMVDGMIEGYNLDETKELPFVYKSAGRILIQPVITEASLAWTTDKGYFYVADANAAKVRFRIETQGEINSPPAHWTPYLYACSLDGYVYAVNEVTGRTIWKFSSGQPINKQPMAIGDYVYILPDLGGMFCLDGKTGAEVWFAPGITDFCSASPTKIYAIDHLNRLTTLDQKTGSRLDTLPLPEIKLKLINQQTDRIYLASDNGVIQCLHEIGLEKPVLHIPPPLEKKGVKETKQKGMDETAEATDEDAPKGKKPAAKKPADDAEEAEEGDAMKAEDDPFGEKE
jgi:DNA-binding beta-propeller fold protein YncE